MKDLEQARELVKTRRWEIRSEPGRYDEDQFDADLAGLEEALAEAGAEIARLKGLNAALDGKEIIHTTKAIGPHNPALEPARFAEGTLLRCTDAPDEWRLTGGSWVHQ